MIHVGQVAIYSNKIIIAGPMQQISVIQGLSEIEVPPTATAMAMPKKTQATPSLKNNKAPKDGMSVETTMQNHEEETMAVIIRGVAIGIAVLLGLSTSHSFGAISSSPPRAT